MTMPRAASTVCRFYIPPAVGDSHFFGRDTEECNTTAQKNLSFVLEDANFMQMVPSMSAESAHRRLR
jgi:hypothetical protein